MQGEREHMWGVRRFVTVVAHMNTVMIMADRRGHRFVVMRMAVMVMGSGSSILQGAQVRCGGAKGQDRQRKQANQEGSDGQDSNRHRSKPYKRMVKAR
jgi:hypothetical protein